MFVEIGKRGKRGREGNEREREARAKSKESLKVSFHSDIFSFSFSSFPFEPAAKDS